MKSQSDIALENQKAIEKINERQARDTTEDDRATRFSGSSEQKNAGGVFKPKEDTPWSMEKRDQKEESPRK